MTAELQVRVKATKDEDEGDEGAAEVDEEDVVDAVVTLPTPVRSKESLTT